MEPTKVRRQRLRVTFTKGDAVKYISHLDMMRLWERALRRASIPVLYSKGYNPRPRMSIAAPLPVGFTGKCEVLDLIVQRVMSPFDFASSVSRQLPKGVNLVEVEEVYGALPSLQSQVRSAEYRVVLESPESQDEMRRRLDALLRSSHVLRTRRGKEYDLRPLVEKLWVDEMRSGECVLGMRLRAGEKGTGRPDEVLAELGLAETVRAMERSQLYLSSHAEAQGAS